MLRGFFTGLIWGGLFSALIAATVSLLLPLPEQRQANMAAPAAAPDTAAQPTPAETQSQPDVSQAPAMSQETPQETVPSADQPADAVAPEMTTETDTKTGAETDTSSDTAKGSAGPSQSGGSPAAAPISEPASEPAVPAVEPQAMPSGTPPEAAAPETAPESVPAAPQATGTGATDESRLVPPAPPPAVVAEPAIEATATGGNGLPPSSGTPSQSEPQIAASPSPAAGNGGLPAQDNAPANAEEAPARITVSIDAPDAGTEAPRVESDSGIDSAAGNGPLLATPEVPKIAQAPGAEQPPAGIAPPQQPQPKIVATEPAQNTPQIPKRIQVGVTRISNSAAGKRLPQIGQGNAEDPQAATPPPGDSANAGVQQPEIALENDTPQPALVSNAVSFENPRDLPLISIILIDDPARPLSDEALSKFPFPVTFAIDANRDDAEDAALKYRKAGYEVIILTDLAKGTKPKDVEIAFQTYKSEIPVAVALMDRNLGGFQRKRELIKEAVANLAETGHGFLSYDIGLNTAEKLAMRAGVKAGLVHRVLDDKREKPEMIRRYLDRAAFRAGKNGQVILLGHTYPDTIEALVLWALEDRAASVAVAPVSAVLKDK